MKNPVLIFFYLIEKLYFFIIPSFLCCFSALFFISYTKQVRHKKRRRKTCSLMRFYMNQKENLIKKCCWTAVEVEFFLTLSCWKWLHHILISFELFFLLLNEESLVLHSFSLTFKFFYFAFLLLPFILQLQSSVTACECFYAALHKI